MCVLLRLFINYNVSNIEKNTQHIAIHYYIITVILHYLTLNTFVKYSTTLLQHHSSIPNSYKYSIPSIINVHLINPNTVSIILVNNFFISLIIDFLFYYTKFIIIVHTANAIPLKHITLKLPNTIFNPIFTIFITN